MKELNIEMGGISLVTFVPDSNDLLHWYVNADQPGNSSTMSVPYFDNLIFNDTVEAKEKGMELLVKVYSKEEKNEYFNKAVQNSDFKYFPDEIKQWLLDQPYLGFSYAIQKHSGIYLEDYTGKLFSDEENNILIRFSRVFEQSYTRFLDLKKAEAQAREAQIEASLERVRARTMAMHHSNELNEAAELLYAELLKLNVERFSCGYTIINEHDRTGLCYLANPQGQIFSKPIEVNMMGDVVLKKMYDGWKKQEPFLSIELNEKKKYCSSSLPR